MREYRHKQPNKIKKPAPDKISANFKFYYLTSGRRRPLYGCQKCKSSRQKVKRIFVSLLTCVVKIFPKNYHIVFIYFFWDRTIPGVRLQLESAFFVFSLFSVEKERCSFDFNADRRFIPRTPPKGCILFCQGIASLKKEVSPIFGQFLTCKPGDPPPLF